MSLKLFWTGHGYNANATISSQEMLTNSLEFMILNNTFAANSSVVGRFTGTRGIAIGDGGLWGTAITKLIPFQSDKIARGAFDINFRTGATNFFVFSYTNGNLVFSDNSVSNALANASTFFGVERTSGSKMQLRVNNVIVATGTTNVNLDTWYHIEWEANVQSAGSFKLWVNNTLDINYSGNITNGLTNTNYRVRFGNFYVSLSGFYLWDGFAEGGFTTYVGDFEPIQILPDGAGITTEGTPVGAGNNWQCVDDVFRNGDTDYVTLSSGQTDLYNFSNLVSTPNLLTMVAQPAYRSNNTNMKIAVECYSNGNTITSNLSSYIGSNGTNWNTYAPIQYTVDFPIDPYTGNAWDANTVNLAQFGISANI